MKITSLWLNANLATFADKNYGIMEKAAIAINEDKIVWLGKEVDLPKNIKTNAQKIHSTDNGWITPGLINCHTHLVYAGNRAREFEQRLQGKTYEEIASQGGGILATVKATRTATDAELFAQSAQRLKQLIAEGVTTVEIKSGYGLDQTTEIRCLKVAKKLAEHFPVTIKTTYLGAHALPPEYSNKDEYINFVCESVLPLIQEQNLADFVDGFCEQIAFSPAQISRVFEKAKQYNLPVKIHAEQLSNYSGAKIAAKFKALSADHLEYAVEEDIIAMAKANTVAVLLPGAFYFLREKQLPPIQLLRKHAVPIAIATDTNPGTAPTTSLLLMANMACTLFNLTPEEVLLGITKHAAQALGLQESLGTLEVGKKADFVLWDINHPAELAYFIGGNPCLSVIKNGLRVT